MTKRIPKRPREEALTIARRLRAKHIGIEAEAAAKTAFASLPKNGSNGKSPIQSDNFAGDAAPNELLEQIRHREGIALKNNDEAPFSVEEQAEARAILDEVYMRFAPKHS